MRHVWLLLQRGEWQCQDRDYRGKVAKHAHTHPSIKDFWPSDCHKPLDFFNTWSTTNRKHHSTALYLPLFCRQHLIVTSPPPALEHAGVDRKARRRRRWSHLPLATFHPCSDHHRPLGKCKHVDNNFSRFVEVIMVIFWAVAVEAETLLASIRVISYINLGS